MQTTAGRPHKFSDVDENAQNSNVRALRPIQSLGGRRLQLEIDFISVMPLQHVQGPENGLKLACSRLLGPDVAKALGIFRNLRRPVETEENLRCRIHFGENAPETDEDHRYTASR